MKRQISAILVALLVLSGVSLWPQASGGKDPGTLVVWMKKGFVDEQNVAFMKRVNDFAAAKHIKVDVEMLAYEDIYPKWTAAIQSGNVPDISFFGYQEVGQFESQGVLEDLTPLLKQIQAKYGAFFPSAIQAITFGGKSYAVPFWGEGTALYYRKDMFQKAGIAAPPQTWDEYRADAVKLTDAANGVYGSGAGYGDGNSDCEWLSRGIIWAFGGSEFAADGKTITIDSPQTRKAIDYITGLFTREKVTPPTALGWNDSGNNTSYLSGQSAMVFNTGSIVNAMKKSAPDLLAVTGYAPLPAGPAGRFTAGISNNLGVFKGAKNKALASELLIYLLDPTWYKEWIDVSAPLALPVYQDLAKNDPIWKDPTNKAFMDSMSTFKYLGYKGSYSPGAGKIYNLRLINALFENILAKGMSVDAALAQYKQDAAKAMLP